MTFMTLPVTGASAEELQSARDLVDALEEWCPQHFLDFFKCCNPIFFHMFRLDRVKI